jgi:hypothetical protein
MRRETFPSLLAGLLKELGAVLRAALWNENI